MFSWQKNIWPRAIVLFGDSIWQFLLGVMLPNFRLGILGDIGKLVPPFDIGYDLSWCMHNLRYNLACSNAFHGVFKSVFPCFSLVQVLSLKQFSIEVKPSCF